ALKDDPRRQCTKLLERSDLGPVDGERTGGFGCEESASFKSVRRENRHRDRTRGDDNAGQKSDRAADQCEVKKTELYRPPCEPSPGGDHGYKKYAEGYFNC